jgi:hypothetical protein
MGGIVDEGLYIIAPSDWLERTDPDGWGRAAIEAMHAKPANRLVVLAWETRRQAWEDAAADVRLSEGHARRACFPETHAPLREIALFRMRGNGLLRAANAMDGTLVSHDGIVIELIRDEDGDRPDRLRISGGSKLPRYEPVDPSKPYEGLAPTRRN